jgi:hypothetical protein
LQITFIVTCFFHGFNIFVTVCIKNFIFPPDLLRDEPGDIIKSIAAARSSENGQKKSCAQDMGTGKKVTEIWAEAIL